MHAGLTQKGFSNNVNLPQTKQQWGRSNALIAKKQEGSTHVPFTPDAHLNNGFQGKGMGRAFVVDIKAVRERLMINQQSKVPYTVTSCQMLCASKWRA